jgi:hypothetical protein
MNSKARRMQVPERRHRRHAPTVIRDGRAFSAHARFPAGRSDMPGVGDDGIVAIDARACFVAFDQPALASQTADDKEQHRPGHR